MNRRLLLGIVISIALILLGMDGWLIFRRDRLLHPDQPPPRPTLGLTLPRVEPSCDDRVDAAHLLGLVWATSAACLWLMGEAVKLYFQE
jgi:hypothetical protein